MHNPWFQLGLHHQLNHNTREYTGSELEPGWGQIFSVLPETFTDSGHKTGQSYLGHTVLLRIKQPDAGHKRKGVLLAVINMATFLKNLICLDF